MDLVSSTMSDPSNLDPGEQNKRSLEKAELFEFFEQMEKKIGNFSQNVMNST